MKSVSRSLLVLCLLVGCCLVVQTAPSSHIKKGFRADDQLSAKDATILKKPQDSLAEASTDYEESQAFLDPRTDFSRALPETPSSESDETQDHSIELQGGSQTFFPSFANLFQPRNQPQAHSRPLLSYNQETAYSQRPNPLKQLLNYQAPSYTPFRSNDYQKPAAVAAPASDTGILGSGNFGVIRGGTFLGESSDTEADSYDSTFYNKNNGHGRPSFYFGNSNPRPNYNQDQFANFRDFADINAPSNPAYSHYVVVYANKNATISDIQRGNNKAIENEKQHLLAEPKNIIERLAQLDKEEQQTVLPAEEEPVKKSQKVSKGKLKLALINDKKYNKKYYKKSSTKSDAKDLADPLLALS